MKIVYEDTVEYIKSGALFARLTWSYPMPVAHLYEFIWFEEPDEVHVVTDRHKYIIRTPVPEHPLRTILTNILLVLFRDYDVKRRTGSAYFITGYTGMTLSAHQEYYKKDPTAKIIASFNIIKERNTYWAAFIKNKVLMTSTHDTIRIYGQDKETKIPPQLIEMETVTLHSNDKERDIVFSLERPQFIFWEDTIGYAMILPLHYLEIYNKVMDVVSLLDSIFVSGEVRIAYAGIYNLFQLFRLFHF